MSRLVLLVAVLVVLVMPSSALAARAPSTAAAITTRDGAVLNGRLWVPDGPGPFPVVVMPSSWALNWAEYVKPAERLRDKGYIVLSYTTRGWYASGGQIDLAGPKDLADASDVIDWVLAHAPADPDHIGMAGVSYGAGISLLTAAMDPRVRAVVSMSGWTDLVDALYGGQTRRQQVVQLLVGVAHLLGHPSPGFQTIADNYFANRDIDGMIAYGNARSAVTYLDALERNRPAVMLANAWHDSLFPPNQLVSFFNAYQGPWHLELRPGDHAVPEAGGLLGAPNNPVWNDAYGWLDHYLRGADNGVQDRPRVLLDPWGAPPPEQYQSWQDVSDRTVTYRLGGRGGPADTGALAGGDAPWSWPLAGGVDTVADGGIALVTNILTATLGAAPTISTAAVDRAAGGIWSTRPLDAPLRVRGAVRLHLTLTADHTGPATIIGYLYDTTADGRGRLVSQAPLTLTAMTAGAAQDAELTFGTDAYDVPAGHRLTLVVDTVDPLYIDRTAKGTTVTLGGGGADPATLALPLR